MSTTLAESGISSGKTTRLRTLLYGPPGSAKTVTAHGMPNTRTIDFDGGMQSVEWAILNGIIDKKLEDIIFETILATGKNDETINMLDRATDQIEEWLDDGTTWDTLIIDSASGLTEASIVKGLKENNRLKSSKSFADWKPGWSVRPMRMQDWGSAGYLQMKFIEMCKSLDKNLILIAHEYVNTSDTGSIISIDPLLIGQNRQTVPGHFDEVWYAHVTGNRKAPEFKIQTTPDSKRRCSSRLGCLDPIEELNYKSLRAKVAKFYSIPAETLWTAATTREEKDVVI